MADKSLTAGIFELMRERDASVVDGASAILMALIICTKCRGVHRESLLRAVAEAWDTAPKELDDDVFTHPQSPSSRSVN